VDIERALLTKALQTGDLAELVARGIDADHFADEDLADLYDWAVYFMSKHAQPPSMTIAREEFADFKPMLTKDPLTWHIERFVLRVKERMAVELVRGYHDMLEDPNEIGEIELRALEMARELTEVVPSPKARRFSEGKARKEEYERRKKKNIQLGLPIGIPTYDEITLGVQPHELLIFGGPPGGGKTTALQYASMNCYLDGQTVLFVSLEVEAEQILRKFDTMRSQISYHALKALKLVPEEEEKWHTILERAEEEKAHKDIIIVDDIRNCTVDKVAAQQIRYKPGVVVVDYLEEMRTPRNVQGWEGVATNGRGLKEAARVTKTPHITATQLNREGETSYQSAQKIADMLIVLIPPEEDDNSKVMKMTMRKYRDGPSRKPVEMHWDLDTMEIRELPTNGHRPVRSGKLGVPDPKPKSKNPWAVKAGK
jgi:KaiC/GvpD/RAD55 family RecA-like ATPase